MPGRSRRDSSAVGSAVSRARRAWTLLRDHCSGSPSATRVRAVSVGARRRESRTDVHGPARTLSRPGCDRDRRAHFHVRRDGCEAADCRNRLRRRLGAVRRAVPGLAVLSEIAKGAQRSWSNSRPTAPSTRHCTDRLTVCGVDRRLFFLALLMGGATFNLFYSFWAGVLVFLGLYGFSLWATSHDQRHAADRSRILRSRRRYDPGKHERFDVEVAPW